MRLYTCAALNTWSWTHTEANPSSSARRASWMMDCTSSIPWLFCNEIPICIVLFSYRGVRNPGVPHKASDKTAHLSTLVATGHTMTRKRGLPVPCLLHTTETAHSSGLVQALHDDLVNLASPFHGTPVHGRDDLLSRRIRIDKEPAL